MEGPHPGGSALLITDSPAPGKYDNNCLLIPLIKNSPRKVGVQIKAPAAYQEILKITIVFN